MAAQVCTRVARTRTLTAFPPPVPAPTPGHLLLRRPRRVGPAAPWRAVGAAVWALLLVLLAGCRATPVPATPEGLDLRGLTSAQAVALVDGWTAQPGLASDLPGRAVDGLALDRSPWRPVPMPATFRAQRVEGADVGVGQGVWYRTRLRLPPGEPIRGLVPPIETPWRLYGVQQTGQVTLLAESVGGSAGQTVFFDLPPAAAVTLLWYVERSGTWRDGPTASIEVGTGAALVRTEARHKAAHALLIGALVMLMLSAFVVWRRRPDDLRPFALAVLTGVLVLRMAVQSGLVELWTPWIGGALTLFDALTLGLLTAALGLLVWSFFPVECAAWGRRGGLMLLPPLVPNEPTARHRAPRPLRHVFTASVVIAWGLGLAVALAAIAVARPEASRALSVGLHLLALPLLGCLGIVVSAAVFRRNGAGIVAVGMGLAVGGMLYDIARTTGWTTGSDAPVAVYTGFAVSILIAVAFTDVFARAAREGLDLSRLLSDRVAVRTRELEDASVAAQAANQAKTQFVSAISHELRTPLAAMLGYASLLEDELADRLTPDQAEFFKVIRTSGDRLDGLVRDLLDLTLIESGRFDVRLGRVRLREVVDEVVAQVRPAVQDKRLHLSVDAVPDVEVVADAQRLRQVLINLLTNAIKFTDEGAVSLSAATAPLDGAPAVAVAVSDTGRGIDDEFRPLLFERFTQAHSAYDATQKGVGLGLAITKELVTRMNGRIDVESKPGQGSTFTVTFPLVSDADDAATADPGAEPRARV